MKNIIKTENQNIIKIETEGDEVITRFNGTFEEAQIYYLNKLFNLGTTSDNMQKCIDVKEDKK